MDTRSSGDDTRGTNHLRRHRLDNFCAPLAPYLERGARVLDVGCGPGSVTLDVACAVDPGRVVGVDLRVPSVAEAIRLGRRLAVANCRFLPGSACALPFAEATFDLTYSCAVLEYIRDPVAALREQMRVTRPGGWVAARAVDFGSMVLYPECPQYEAMTKLMHAVSASGNGVYFDAALGRKLYGLLGEAGCRDVRVECFIPPLSVATPGSEFFEWRYRSIQVDPGKRSPILEQLADRGLVPRDVMAQVYAELEAWHRHPGAFYMIGAVLAAGRVV